MSCQCLCYLVLQLYMLISFEAFSTSVKLVLLMCEGLQQLMLLDMEHYISR